jgi:hypothetical protein
MTMVQYQSAVYEEQWKFPLVSQLCERIILSSLLDPDLGVSYKTFRYKDDTSLIIYRKSREYLVNNLLPHGQAQALHIVPYPDGNLQDRERALTEQVRI